MNPLIKLYLKTFRLRYFFNSLSYYVFYNKNNLEYLRNSYRGKPLLIVGNGPSLNKTPLDNFTDTPSIGMNKINLIFDKVDWRPTLILCSNRLVIKQNSKFYLQTDIPVFLSWKGRSLIHKSKRNNIKYYLELPTKNFSKNIVKGLSVSSTITDACLQFAYFMGANPIILFGIDHSYNYSGKPNEISRMRGKDTNHFDKNYFAEGQNWGIPNLEESEKSYIRAKKIFELENRQIYDATIDGKLNIFKKIDLSQAYDLVKSK